MPCALSLRLRPDLPTVAPRIPDGEPPAHAFLPQQPEGFLVVDCAVAHQLDDGAGDEPPVAVTPFKQLHLQRKLLAAPMLIGRKESAE